MITHKHTNTHTYTNVHTHKHTHTQTGMYKHTVYKTHTRTSLESWHIRIYIWRSLSNGKMNENHGNRSSPLNLLIMKGKTKE